MTETIECAPGIESLEVPAASIPTTPVLDVELRGLPLLDLVITQIELSPDTWRQGAWRCETGMCVAGWAATLAGGQWLVPVDDEENEPWMAYLVPEAYDRPENVGTTLMPEGETKYVTAEERARNLLGLTEIEASMLFSGSNSLERVKAVRDHIALGVS